MFYSGNSYSKARISWTLEFWGSEMKIKLFPGVILTSEIPFKLGKYLEAPVLLSMRPAGLTILECAGVPAIGVNVKSSH